MIKSLLSKIFSYLKNFIGSSLKLVFQYHSGSGDNVGGNKYSFETKKFSDNQSIRLWPEDLGGNHQLNLDNLVTLSYLEQLGKTGISLALNSAKTAIPNPVPGNNELELNNLSAGVNTAVEGVQYRDFVLQQIPQNQKICNFDLVSHKVHDVEIRDRKFTVTLNEIVKQTIPSVNSATEYNFGISEK